MDTSISFFGIKLRFEIIVIIVIIWLLVVGQTCYSCYRPSGYNLGGSLGYSKFEGFSGYGSGTGTGSGPGMGNQFASYGQNSRPVNTKNWGLPTLVVRPGQPLTKGVQDILNREPQPIPLPEGELSMFATTPFKPECCAGNSYSNSSGCPCMTVQQYNYIIERGGNNVPYSEY